MAEAPETAEVPEEESSSPPAAAESEIPEGEESDSESQPMELMSRSQKFLVVTYSVVCLVIPVAYFIQNYGEVIISITGESVDEDRLLVLCALLGAAMGSVHSLASIAVHAGKGNLGAPWVIFYLCRPFTGLGIALVTCLALMSGVGGFQVNYKDDPRPLLTWSALAGLYSQPALDKLRELFDTLFRTRKQDEEEAQGKGAGAKS